MSYIFGGNTGETAESLRRKRAVAEAMLQQSSQAPRNIGEGLSAIGNALAGRVIERRVEREEGKRKAAATGDFDAILGGMGSPAVDPRTGGAVGGTPGFVPPVETRPLGNPGSFDESGDYAAAIEAPATSGDPRAYALKKLTDMGYEPHIAAGLVGNLVQESGPNLDPTAVGDNGNSFGAGQWNGPRKDALMSFAQTSGLDANSLDTQLAFLDHEMKGPESAAFAAIQGAQTPEEAARIASEKFWRPGDPRVENRQRYASEVYSLGSQQPGIKPTAQALSQPAQSGAQPGMAGLDPRLLRLASNEYLSEPQRMVVNALLQRQIAQGNPDQLTAYQREQIAIQRERLKMEGANAGRGQFGLDPIYGTDAEGNQVILQLGRDGQPNQVRLPDGVKPSPGVQRVDLGTSWGILNRQGEVVSTIPKDVAGEARAEATGSAEGQAQFAAPAQLATAENAMRLVDELLSNPQLDRAIGNIEGRLPAIAGWNSDAVNRIEQLQGQTFLEAFTALKGGGAITEMEGKKAQEAIARLNRVSEGPEYRQALKELRDILALGAERARKRIPANGAQPAAPAQPPAAPKVLRYNPATGELE